MKRSIAWVFTGCLVLACSDDAPSDVEGTDGETGDGDGDPGDGDGDSGDGDGDPGDGDGDGDPGDGDGDGDGDYPLDDLLTLDHVQVKGTHNSYHIEPDIPLDPSHEYTHPPLDVQLEDHGVRSFELDLHQAGDIFQVYHIVGIDSLTTCNTLVACLTTIRTWSDANQDHVPIMIWFEIKDSTGGADIDDLTLVDQTILEVFAPDRVLTPDFVRGDHPTLRDALTIDGWPTLGQVRGKVMFMILNGDHGSVPAYTYGNTGLQDRLMFVGTDDFSSPYAAVSKINDPASPNIALAHAAQILTASNTCSAGNSDAECFAELDAALLSGTHNLMDDFLAPVGRMTYFLDFVDGSPVRCNSATAPDECTAAALEAL